MHNRAEQEGQVRRYIFTVRGEGGLRTSVSGHVGRTGQQSGASTQTPYSVRDGGGRWTPC